MITNYRDCDIFTYTRASCPAVSLLDVGGSRFQNHATSRPQSLLPRIDVSHGGGIPLAQFCSHRTRTADNVVGELFGCRHKQKSEILKTNTWSVKLINNLELIVFFWIYNCCTINRYRVA